MQTQSNSALRQVSKTGFYLKYKTYWATCLWNKTALGRVRPQMSEVSVMYGKAQIQTLQRRTQCPCVILGKIRTSLLTIQMTRVSSGD